MASPWAPDSKSKHYGSAFNGVSESSGQSDRASGRKSASPHFFKKEFIRSAHGGSGTGSAFAPRPSSHNPDLSHAYPPPLTAQQLFAAATLLNSNSFSQHSINFLNNFYSPLSGSSSTVSSATSTSSAFGSPVGYPPHADAFHHIKLPTTPTRSKSLSPSSNNMPPRMRHKRQQADDGSDAAASPPDSIAPPPLKSTNFFEPIRTGHVVLDKPPQAKVRTATESSGGSAKPSPVKEQGAAAAGARRNAEAPSERPESGKKEASHVRNGTPRPAPVLAEKTNLVKYKMPMNVRTLNLTSYPANKAPTSKRQYSIILTKMKSTANLSKEQCCEVLKNNLQTLFNLTIHQTVETFKKEFIDPVLANIERNAIFSQRKDLCGEEEVKSLLSRLLEDASRWYNKCENDDPRSSTADAGRRAGESGFRAEGKENVKRDRDAYADDDDDYDADKPVKKTRNGLDVLPTAMVSASPALGPHEVAFPTAQIDDATQFVLGKHANDLYFQFQQVMLSKGGAGGCSGGGGAAGSAEDESDQQDEQPDDMQTFNANKNIYSNHPNLFKYEADANDRHWLKENGVLKRKNNKCYLLLSSDVAALFQAKFFSRPSEAADLREQFAKKLKSFALSARMIEKVKRRYSFHVC